MRKKKIVTQHLDDPIGNITKIDGECYVKTRNSSDIQTKYLPEASKGSDLDTCEPPPPWWPGGTAIIAPSASGHGCPNPWPYSYWTGWGYSSGIPGLPGNEVRAEIPFTRNTNRWHMNFHLPMDSEAAKYWREIDNTSKVPGGNISAPWFYNTGPKEATLITKEGKLIAHTYAYSVGIAHSAQSFPRDTYVVLDYDSRGHYNNRPQSWQVKTHLRGSFLAAGHIQGLEPM